MMAAMTDRYQKGHATAGRHEARCKISIRQASSEVGGWFRSFAIDCQYLAAFAGSRKNQGNRRRSTSQFFESGISMSHLLNKKQMSLAVACALALGIASGTASAQ